jgi:hypothetical protein
LTEAGLLMEAATVSTYVVRFLPKLAEFEISARALRQALE